MLATMRGRALVTCDKYYADIMAVPVHTIAAPLAQPYTRNSNGLATRLGKQIYKRRSQTCETVIVNNFPSQKQERVFYCHIEYVTEFQCLRRSRVLGIRRSCPLTVAEEVIGSATRAMPGGLGRGPNYTQGRWIVIAVLRGSPCDVGTAFQLDWTEIGFRFEDVLHGFEIDGGLQNIRYKYPDKLKVTPDTRGRLKKGDYGAGMYGRRSERKPADMRHREGTVLPGPMLSTRLSRCPWTIKSHSCTIATSSAECFVEALKLWHRCTTRPSPRRTGFDSRRGRSRIFACVIHAGRCCWSAGFLGDILFPPPLHSNALHSHLFSHSPAFNTLMLRAAQISPLDKRIASSGSYGQKKKSSSGAVLFEHRPLIVPPCGNSGHNLEVILCVICQCVINSSLLSKVDQGSGSRKPRAEPPYVKQVIVRMSIYGAMSSGNFGTCSLAHPDMQQQLWGKELDDYSTFTLTSNFYEALLKFYFQDVSPPYQKQSLTKSIKSHQRDNAVHDKVSTSEITLRTKSLLRSAHILTGTLSDMRPVKSVHAEKQPLRRRISGRNPRCSAVQTELPYRGWGVILNFRRTMSVTSLCVIASLWLSSLSATDRTRPRPPSPGNKGQTRERAYEINKADTYIRTRLTMPPFEHQVEGTLIAISWQPTRVKRGEYGALPECKSEVNGRSPRKPADKRESNQAHLGGRRVF
ncbi:hypothetical protein PR048_015288 [Dryococelus australis]|uniref:Uncharacterized protein n=1 Tax=Dryococelus australis TaxID=614101 RepID=A0ABQ9HGP4_9NEOP|nr:hypothetical protein PR048_015288 [Dryococelus australis]